MGRRVLIVDDHDDFRRSAAALLESEGFTVVGEAPDGEAALVEVERLRPDVVLLDVQLQGADGHGADGHGADGHGADGFAVAERLAADADPPAVVLISSRERSAYEPRLGVSSVLGFIAKRDLSGATLIALVG